MEHADKMIENVISKLNGFDTVILAHGILPDQKNVSNPLSKHRKHSI
jgi:hypothetical protein